MIIYKKQTVISRKSDIISKETVKQNTWYFFGIPIFSTEIVLSSNV